MRKPEKMTDAAKTLWAVAAALGAGVGVASLQNYLDPRDPTPAEMAQMDHTLRPAAVGAARAALRLYAEHPDSGFITKPPKQSPQPANAVELVVGGKKYTFDVSMRKTGESMEMNPETVYDLDIYKGADPRPLIVSAIDTHDGILDSQLLSAQSSDGSIHANFMAKLHHGEAKEDLIDAKEIAKFVREETALFEQQGPGTVR